MAFSRNGMYAQTPAYAGGSFVPLSNYGSGFGASNPFNFTNGMNGIAGILGGLFGNSGAPYDAAEDQYKKYIGMANNIQNPFYNAGTTAIPQFQDFLKRMSDPSGFINGLMNQYQESPWAKYSQQQGLRAATNLGSATGLTGSTPLQLQAQQNAQNISSEDMNKWLQNVLGINTGYGAGLQNLITGGGNAANALTSLYGDYGKSMGEAEYGRQAGENQDFSNLISGGLSLASMFL